MSVMVMSVMVTSCSGLAPSTPVDRKPLICAQLTPDVSRCHAPISTPLAFNGHYTRSCHKEQSTVDITSLECGNHFDRLIDTFEGLNLSAKHSDCGIAGRLRPSPVANITETITEKSNFVTHRRTRSSATPIQSNCAGIATDCGRESTIDGNSIRVSQTIDDQRNLAPQKPTPTSKLSLAKSRPSSDYLPVPLVLKKPTGNASPLGHGTKQIRDHDVFKRGVRTSSEEILLDSEDSDESWADSEDDLLDSDYLDESEADSDAAYGSSATESDFEERREPITPTKRKNSPQRLSNSALKIVKSPSRSSMSAPATPISADLGTPEQKIGFRGEQYVVELLKKEVTGFDESSHWTSNLRHFANLLPYGKSEVTDVQCLDTDGSLSRCLKNAAVGKIPKWLKDACVPGDRPRPKYWIEVKTTVGDRKKSFFVTKNQYHLMKEIAIHGKGMLEEVYVLLRVFDIDGKPEFSVYIDHWTKIRGGLLTIAEYIMTTG